MHRPPVGQKYLRDRVRPQSCAFKEPGLQQRRGERWVHQNDLIALAQQRGGGMAGTYGNLFPPNRVLGKSPDTQ